MCRCDDKKVNWYLSRNLAKVVAENPPIIQLTFVPKGEGHEDLYYLLKKNNVCAVCGGSKELTRHHLVPHEYRRHFPDYIKKHNSYDILLLCVDCHVKYEETAVQFKKQIAEEMGIQFHNPRNLNKRLVVAKRIANTLLTHGDAIPQSKKDILLARISESLDKKNVDFAELSAIAALELELPPPTKNQAQQVVEQLPDLFTFVVRWREHFVETMSPKFLPAYWETDKSL